MLDLIYERHRLPADGRPKPGWRSNTVGDDKAGGVEAPGTVGRANREPSVRVEVWDSPRAMAQDHADGAIGSGPLIRVGGRTVRVPSREELTHYAHLIILNVAAAGAADLNVLHAAALVRDGQALVLVGPSGAGKSTLTLGLLGRGWRFLSDDFAPIESDGTVQPFPRRIIASEAALRLAGLSPPKDALRMVGFDGASNWVMSGESAFPGCTADAGVARTVVLLGGTARPERGPGVQTSDATWMFRLDHLPAGLASDVRSAQGVTWARAVPGQAPHLLSVAFSDPAYAVPALDEVFARADVTVLHSRRSDTPRAPFGESPVARRLELRESLPALVASDLGLSGRRYLERASRDDPLLSLSRLHRALVHAQARIYSLEPGPLDATVDMLGTLPLDNNEDPMVVSGEPK